PAAWPRFPAGSGFGAAPREGGVPETVRLAQGRHLSQGSGRLRRGVPATRRSVPVVTGLLPPSRRSTVMAAAAPPAQGPPAVRRADARFVLPERTCPDG